jgi:hypothetical protein
VSWRLKGVDFYQRVQDGRERYVHSTDVVAAGWVKWAVTIPPREKIIWAWHAVGSTEECVGDLQACCMGKRRRET